MYAEAYLYGSPSSIAHSALCYLEHLGKALSGKSLGEQSAAKPVVEGQCCALCLPGDAFCQYFDSSAFFILLMILFPSSLSLHINHTLANETEGSDVRSLWRHTWFIFWFLCCHFWWWPYPLISFPSPFLLFLFLLFLNKALHHGPGWPKTYQVA